MRRADKKRPRWVLPDWQVNRRAGGSVCLVPGCTCLPAPKGLRIRVVDVTAQLNSALDAIAGAPQPFDILRAAARL